MSTESQTRCFQKGHPLAFAEWDPFRSQRELQLPLADKDRDDRKGPPRRRGDGYILAGVLIGLAIGGISAYPAHNLFILVLGVMVGGIIGTLVGSFIGSLVRKRAKNKIQHRHSH